MTFTVGIFYLLCRVDLNFFVMLTPDFSNYTCFLIITVWAFVEHIIVFTAVSFT